MFCVSENVYVTYTVRQSINQALIVKIHPNFELSKNHNTSPIIQGVTDISALILTSDVPRREEQ